MNPYAAAILLLALALTGCGGGGGGGGGGEEGGGGGGGNPPPSDGVALATRADLLRELGIVGAIDRFLFVVEGSGAKAKAASTVQCNLAGTYTTDSGSRSYVFDLFDNQARTVEFFSTSSAQCKNTLNDGSVATSDGVQEFGSEDGQGTSYGYLVGGASDKPYSLSVQAADSASFYIDSLLGTVQRSLTAAASETRVRATVERFDQNGSQSRRLSLKPGDGTGTFRRLLNRTTGALTLAGPYRYAGTNCAGGKAEVATPSALTLNGQGDVNGGQLRLSADSATVTVTFNSDGSASFQFQGGPGGTLTAAEVQAALEVGIC